MPKKKTKSAPPARTKKKAGRKLPHELPDPIDGAIEGVDIPRGEAELDPGALGELAAIADAAEDQSISDEEAADLDAKADAVIAERATKRAKKAKVEPPKPNGHDRDSRRRTRNLLCHLTEAEVHERAASIAQNVVAIGHEESLLAQLSEQVKGRKGRIDFLHNENARLANVVKECEEYRDVACEEHAVGLAWITTRLDTGEKVDERTMTANERQGSLL